MPRKRKDKLGPKPDYLKLEGDWEEAVKKALRKGKPEEKGKKPK